MKIVSKYDYFLTRWNILPS